MNSVKLERINSAIKRELSYVIANEVKDRSIDFVTVTAVRTTNDLSYCKVYVTVFKDELREDALKALKNAKGFIRKVAVSR